MQPSAPSCRTQASWTRASSPRPMFERNRLACRCVRTITRSRKWRTWNRSLRGSQANASEKSEVFTLSSWNDRGTASIQAAASDRSNWPFGPTSPDRRREPLERPVTTKLLLRKLRCQSFLFILGQTRIHEPDSGAAGRVACLRCLLVFRPLKRCHSMRKASWNSPRARCSTCSPASARACSWSIAPAASSGSTRATSASCRRWASRRSISSSGHMVEDVVPNTQMRRVLETGQADPGRPAHQPGRHLRREPPAAARRAERRADRRDRHRAVRPSRNHAAAADQQVRAPAARPGRRPARTGEPAPHQVHPRQLRRRQPGGGGGQAAGAARGAVVQPGAAAGRDRHRQGTAGACDPRGLGARGRAACQRQHRGRARHACWKPSSSASRRAPTPAPIARAATASSSWPTAARCSSTRSATCRSACSPSCCARLQEGEIEPLGSNKVIAFDARVIAATSRDLGGAGARGQVPRGPLLPAERAADPRAAAARATRPTSRRWSRCSREDMALRSGSAPPELGADAIALLSAQNWRGNIRELRNVLEQAAMRSDSQHIEVQRSRGSAARIRHQGDRPAQPCCAACRDRLADPGAAPAGRAGGRTGAAGHRRRARVDRRQQAGGRQTARESRAPSSTNGWTPLSDFQACVLEIRQIEPV